MTKHPSQTIRTIRPDNRVHDGVIGAFWYLLKEVGRYREQIWALYRRNFRSSYFGSGLGVIWNFILPLVPVTVYWFLAQIRVFPNFEGVDGSTYLTFGVTIWFVFAGFVQNPISAVQTGKSEAMRTALPLSTSIISSFANLIFETLVRLVLVIGIIFITKSWPTVYAPGLFLVFISGFFLFFGIGLFLSIWNAIYRDVSRVTAILLQYGIFVSGVIFPLGASTLSQLSNKFNPFAVYVNASREIVFEGTISNILPLAIWSAIGVTLFLLGCRLFYVMEHRIREIS